jgi:hypothetical protein
MIDNAASGGSNNESAGGKPAADKGLNKAISELASKASTCVVINSHINHD